MLNAFRNKRSNILVWVLMVMLVVGLAGFGIGVSGGLGNQDVAQVGDRSVTAEQYGRALDQELRSISSQLGRNLPMSEARQYGIDRMVLGRLVNDATLDAEASRLGLSMGDETVREQVVAAPAFRGPDGKFDRDTYAFVLERTGLSPAEFEEQVRRVTVEVFWTEGETERSFDVLQYVVGEQPPAAPDPDSVPTP